MSERDDFDRAFLDELSALDAFFDRRAETHEHFKLGRQDPDVRRILEAVAFFAARTRRLAATNVRAAVERLVRGQLDDLLWPIPTAGMLLAHVDEGLGAPASIPEGTEVRLTAPDRSVGVFSTRRRLDLLPLRLHSVEAPPGVDRLVMRLDAWIDLRGPQAPLAFWIDARGSYRDSLRLLVALQSYVRGVRVAFDEDAPEAAIVAPFSIGALPPPPEGDGQHPLARVRSFFHFPAQDLFFSVTLPSRRRAWTRAFVYLDLARDPPRELLRAGRQAFVLHAVPIENARHREALPIVCDGTKDSYPIVDARSEAVSAGREARAELCSIEGVYRLGDRGREPVVPALLAETGAAYDPVLVRPGEEAVAEEPPRIALRIPGAFQKPCKVIVDARWYQPSFDASAVGLLQPWLHTRRVDGMRLEVAGDLYLSQRSPLEDDALGLLHVMALRTKVTLSRDELCALLDCLGADRRSHFRRLPELIKDVRTEEAPRGAGQGHKYLYSIDYRRDDPDFEGLLRDGLVAAFEDRVAAVLDAWIADDVELRRYREPLPGEARRPAVSALAGAA